jgi:hypothetical protein
MLFIRRIHLRCLKNGTTVLSVIVGVSRWTIVTHCAYTISEYNEVYTNLICNTLEWKLRSVSLLTDDVKPLVLSRGFDGTKDDQRITELWKQLEFFAWFLM